jgi:hypothetical protein
LHNNDGWISGKMHIGSGRKRLGLSGLRKWKVAGHAWQPPALEHFLQVHVKEKRCRSAIPVYGGIVDGVQLKPKLSIYEANHYSAR